MDEYLSGRLLYGDDLRGEELNRWYADEMEGYADLGSDKKDRYVYNYHQLNWLHGFRYLSDKTVDMALGIGSAYGDEFAPIADRVRQLTIIEPSEILSSSDGFINVVPCSYVKPNPSGEMPFSDNTFDLITSFGVMHHIPNVSYVIGECVRVLKPGGVMLLREPIVSMGDWTRPREGLTKRERGIPLRIMDSIVNDAGFTVQHRAPCDFPIISRFAHKLNVLPYNNAFFTMLDAVISRMFLWNARYHRTSIFHKIAPASAFYVLVKA